MIQLIKSLFATPGAESDPSSWATRYVAHLGLGVATTVVLIALLPVKYALSVAVLGYVLWEATQYRAAPPEARTTALAWDSVLDMTAWSSGVLIVGSLVTGDVGGAVLAVAGSVVAACVGVNKRKKQFHSCNTL